MAPTFTPYASLAGGGLIGLAATLLMALHGRIAGCSGIATGLLPPWLDAAVGPRFAFCAGLIVAPLIYAAATGARAPVEIGDGPLTLGVAGLLVGFGAGFGGGCTSGHGVCGFARLSVRSFVATGVFMLVAIVTTFVARHAI